ncbi:hypothetical protein MTO96_002929 [Rhipicephalus appendiculatus]
MERTPHNVGHVHIAVVTSIGRPHFPKINLCQSQPRPRGHGTRASSGSSSPHAKDERKNGKGRGMPVDAVAFERGGRKHEVRGAGGPEESSRLDG